MLALRSQGGTPRLFTAPPVDQGEHPGEENLPPREQRHAPQRTPGGSVRFSAQAWGVAALLSEQAKGARIIEIDRSEWVDLHREIRDWCSIQEDNGESLARVHGWPPDRIPFPQVFLAPSDPIAVETLNFSEVDETDTDGMYLLGYYADASDIIIWFLGVDEKVREAHILENGSLTDGPGFRDRMSLILFIWAVLDIIGQRTSVTLETRPLKKAHRRKLSKSLKRPPDGVIPREFHQVRIEGHLRWAGEERQPGSGTNRRCWSIAHRFDVRGHWCVRVRRGLEPLEPEQLQELQGRGYVLERDAGERLPDELDEALRQRCVPRRKRGEWLAVLRYWRGEHQRGPDDAPYVPSVWVVPDVAHDDVADTQALETTT